MNSLGIWRMLIIILFVQILVKAEPEENYLFTFGDSYTMTSFNPEGQQATPAQPMGNPELGTGTSSGGINWVGYLTTVFNTSIVLSYNLAVGGATIDNNLVNAVVTDMATQVAHFQSKYSSRPGIAPWKSKNTVFGVWIGINDIGWSFSTQNASVLVPRLMARYKWLAEELYCDGARKFVFVNVPPTSRSPYIMSRGLESSRQHAAWLSIFNQGLKLMVLELRDAHPDANIVLYDSWHFMTGILNKPDRYGYPNATCVNYDGTTCIWWNDYHPGHRYHMFQAADMTRSLRSLGPW